MSLKEADADRKAVILATVSDLNAFDNTSVTRTTALLVALEFTLANFAPFVFWDVGLCIPASHASFESLLWRFFGGLVFLSHRQGIIVRSVEPGSFTTFDVDEGQMFRGHQNRLAQPRKGRSTGEYNDETSA